MKRITYIILLIASIYGVFYFTLGRSWLASLIFSAIAFGVLYVPINKIADKVDEDVDFYYYRTWLSRLLLVVGVVVAAIGVFLSIYLPFSFSLYGSIALAAMVCLALFPFILSPLCNIDWQHKKQVRYMKKHKDEIVEKLRKLMDTHGCKISKLSSSDVCVYVKFTKHRKHGFCSETYEEEIECIEDVEELGENLKGIMARIAQEDEKIDLILERIHNNKPDCIGNIFYVDGDFIRKYRYVLILFNYDCVGYKGRAGSYKVDFDRELDYYDNVPSEIERLINKKNKLIEQVKRLKCEYEKNEYIHEINTKIKEDQDEDIGLYFEIEVVYVKDKAITGGELWSFEVEAHSTSDMAMVEKKIDSRIDECRRRDQMVENAISKACKNYNISRTTVERCLQSIIKPTTSADHTLDIGLPLDVFVSMCSVVERLGYKNMFEHVEDRMRYGKPLTVYRNCNGESRYKIYFVSGALNGVAPY